MANLDGTVFITQPGVTPNAAPPHTTQRASAATQAPGAAQPMPFASLGAPITSQAPANASSIRVGLPYIPEAPVPARRPTSRHHTTAGMSSRAALQLSAEQRAVFPTDDGKDPRVEHPMPLGEHILDARAAAAPQTLSIAQAETPAEATRIVMEQKASPAAFEVFDNYALIPESALQALTLRIDALELRVNELEESLLEESATESESAEPETSTEENVSDAEA